MALSRASWALSASSSSGMYPPANAVDGDLTTRWASGANQGSSMWFEIDLGSTKKFSQIVFDATNSSGDEPNAYAVYVSSDAMSWGSSVATGTGSSSIVTIGFAEQTARYVRVQITAASGSWWSIDEVNVYSANPPAGTPIPQARSGWTATASVSGPGNPPSYAIDGDSSTYWNTSANQASGMWLELAMKGPVTFSQITIPTYMGLPAGVDTNYPGTYAVYVSNDGVTWGSAIATGTGTPAGTVTFAEVTARYVQVSLTAGNGYWWTLSEFDLYRAAN